MDIPYNTLLPYAPADKAFSHPSSSSSGNRRGIILTNIELLAIRFGLDSDSIRSCLQGYINDVSQYIDYTLLDLSTHPSTRNTRGNWQAIQSLLSHNDNNHAIQSPSYLFIIGSSDIVPQPFVSLFGKEIATDIVYASEQRLIFTDKAQCKDVLTNRQKFLVGRLPLGTDASFDMLQNYLERSAEAMTAGIPVQMAFAQSDPSWKDMSKMVVQQLIDSDYLPPLPDTPGYFHGRVTLSPEVTESNIDNYFNPYANLYYFNLHGDSDSNHPMFYGTQSTMGRRIIHEAISPHTISQALQQNIVVTEACFGGKHDGLETSQSMLLSAISSSTLLYLGSTIPCYCLDPSVFAEERKMEWADALAHAFIQCLAEGMSGGEALVHARRVLINQEQNERIPIAILTIFCFSLYGDPALHAHFPNMPASHRLADDKPYTTSRFDTDVLFGATSEDRGLLGYVRQRVDKELNELNALIQRRLDAAGFDDCQLSSVVRFRHSKGSQRLFSYTTQYGEAPIAIYDEQSKQIHLAMPKSCVAPPPVDYRSLFQGACRRFGLINYNDSSNRPAVGTTVPESPQAPLTVIDGRIEERSKTLIHTFKKVFDIVYRPVIVNGDHLPDVSVMKGGASATSCYDFIPLVSPLALMLETELRSSIIPYLKACGKSITNKQKPTFGVMVSFIQDNIESLKKQNFSNADAFVNKFADAVEKRNIASHNRSDEKLFVGFYNLFISIVTDKDFGTMMELKDMIRNTQHKTLVMADNYNETNRFDGSKPSNPAFDMSAKDGSEEYSPMEVMHISAGKIFFSLRQGTVAMRVSEETMDSLLNVEGMVVEEGTSAYIFIDGQLSTAIHGGVYQFIDADKFDRLMKQRFGGIKNWIKKPWKLALRFFMGTSLQDKADDMQSIQRFKDENELRNALEHQAACSIWLVRDNSFPLTFEQRIATTRYEGMVGIIAAARIVDFGLFRQAFPLSGKVSFVTTERVRDALTTALGAVLRGMEFINGEVTAEQITNLYQNFSVRVESQNTGIEIVNISDCSVNSNDLERLRDLDRQLNLSEEEIAREQRIKDFKDRLCREDTRRELDAARDALTVATITASINKDQLLLEEEVNAFNDAIILKRQIRQYDDREKLEEAANKVLRSRILRQEEVDALVDDIRKKRHSRENEFTMLQMSDTIRLRQLEQQALHGFRLSEAQNEVEVRRTYDDYGDERFGKELEKKKAETALQQETVRTANAIEIEKLDNLETINDRFRASAHQRQMDKLDALLTHDEKVKEMETRVELASADLTAVSKMDAKAQEAYMNSLGRNDAATARAETLEQMMERLNQNSQETMRLMQEQSRMSLSAIVSVANGKKEDERRRGDEYREELHRSEARNENILTSATGKALAEKPVGQAGPKGSSPVPPARPQSAYHVYIDNKVKGPYTWEQICQLVDCEVLTRDTKVWRKGFPDWLEAGSVEEFKPLFGQDADAATPSDLPPLPS